AKAQIDRFEEKLEGLDLPETPFRVPLRQVSIYLISGLTSLLTQWVLDDMPKSPETMDTNYQTLAYPTLKSLLSNEQK
ncbi:MAG: TetR-like C-terminal domain-containing protein, partial [Chloroflexota bacterium]